jgi:predicted O-methyltransferase YrrM
VVGLFEDTLPTWLAQHPDPITFVHIDCDLYSSTKTVLTHIGPRVQAGTIIVFDEYMNGLNFYDWPDGEHRALDEADFEWELIGSAVESAAVKVV